MALETVTVHHWDWKHSNGAIFSPDRRYRFVLYRVWDETKPRAMCIGLNPSTANESKDDPTIRTLTAALTNLGFGGFYMLNLFSFISADPEALRLCSNPVSDTDAYLKQAKLFSDEVIFCWGDFSQAEYRVKAMLQLFPSAKCFGKSKSGAPIHPLALMYKGIIKSATLETF